MAFLGMRKGKERTGQGYRLRLEEARENSKWGSSKSFMESIPCKQSCFVEGVVPCAEKSNIYIYVLFLMSSLSG